MDTTGILKHLGVIKNQLLIFTLLGMIVTHGFARSLVGSEDHGIRILGGCMHASTILMFFTFGIFYFYALLKLPGSTQEMKFEESAREAVQAHAEALERTGNS